PYPCPCGGRGPAMTLRPALLAAAALATAIWTCLALGRWGAGAEFFGHTAAWMRDVLCDLLRQAYGRDDNRPPCRWTAAPPTPTLGTTWAAARWRGRSCGAGRSSTRRRPGCRTTCGRCSTCCGIRG